MIRLLRRRAGQHRAADATVLVAYVPVSSWPPPAPPVRHLTSPPQDPWLWDSDTIITDVHTLRLRMEQYL